MTSSAQIMDEITVEALNQLSCSQHSLIQLRLLNCSDLTFHFMLLKPSTVRDIIHNSLELLQIDLEEDTHCMSVEEHTEFHNLIGNMRQFSEGVDN